MMRYRVAVPAAVLLVGLSIPSAGQTSDDAAGRSNFVAPVQTPAQGAPVPGAQKLSAEELADIHMARKEYFEAAVSFKKLTAENPKNAVYWNKLGIALQQQSDLSGALKSYQRAAKADPTYADAQNNMGTVWYERKRFSKSIRAYQRAIKLRENMAVLYSNLGYAYFGDKKYEESIASFRQALALDPRVFDHSASSHTGSVLQDRSVSDRGRFYFLLAKSFAQTGNFERSLIYLRKAKEEGYKAMDEVKTDPAFSAMLNLPETQEILAPKNADPTQP